HPLRQRLAPRAAALVLRAGDRDPVAAGRPAAALAAAGLVAAPAPRRSAPRAAAGLGGPGAAVLLAEPGQARGLHLSRAARALPGRGAAAAGAAAARRRAVAAVGL